MEYLGIPQENLHFLRLPEGRLRKHTAELYQSFTKLISEIEPAHILAPFRYDRHTDHLTLNQVVTAACQQHAFKANLAEYFVYYRWRLMPKRDIRRYIRPQFLFKLEIGDVAQQKRQALDCFTSQTTIYYPWQTRPILTSILLDEECLNPEFFLISNDSSAGAAVFSNSVLWIHLVHRLEPFLQRWKYRVGAYLKRLLQNYVRE